MWWMASRSPQEPIPSPASFETGAVTGPVLSAPGKGRSGSSPGPHAAAWVRRSYRANRGRDGIASSGAVRPVGMLNTGRGAAADGRALRTQDTPRSAKVGPPRPSLPRRSVCRVLCGMLGGDPRLEPRSEPTSPTWISLQRLLLADTALL